MTTIHTQSQVGAMTFATPTDLEIVATRVIDAPRDLVWEVHTRPQHVRQWMLGPDGWTMPVCEIDLRPGGRWHFVWRLPAERADMPMSGTYREVAPPERLVSTESWGPDWPETLNTIALAEHGGRTTLTATILYPTKQARDAAMATGMKGGWAKSYERLDQYLQTLGHHTSHREPS